MQVGLIVLEGWTGGRDGRDASRAWARAAAVARLAVDERAEAGPTP